MNIEIKFVLNRGAYTEEEYIKEFRATLAGIQESLNNADYCADIFYDKWRNVFSADRTEIIGNWRIKQDE